MAYNICDTLSALTLNPENKTELISKVETIMEAIVEECCVCMQIMDRRIYLCVNGHSVCGTCTKKIDNCPMCKGDMTDEQNYELENLARIYKRYKDKYNNNVDLKKCNFKGCDMDGTKEMMLAHHKICQYGPSAVCAWCNNMVFHNKILDHWKSHCQEVENNVEFLAQKAAHLTVYKEHFIIVRNIVDNYYLYVVHHLTYGGETEFFFKLTLKNQISGREICINGPCVASTPVQMQADNHQPKNTKLYGVTVADFEHLFYGCNKKYIYKVIVYSKNPNKI